MRLENKNGRDDFVQYPFIRRNKENMGDKFIYTHGKDVIRALSIPLYGCVRMLVVATLDPPTYLDARVSDGVMQNEL